jgi:hypothetical protein
LSFNLSLGALIFWFSGFWFAGFVGGSGMRTWVEVGESKVNLNWESQIEREELCSILHTGEKI